MIADTVHVLSVSVIGPSGTVHGGHQAGRLPQGNGGACYVCVST
jgi:hypothetical protein